MTRPRALVLHGGWPGHEPERTAEIAGRLLAEFDVEYSSELESLSLPLLARFDLLVPIWTYGELAPAREQALLEAVAGGLGLLAWHGAASAFLVNRRYKLLLGGQFVAHPGGGRVRYTVQFERSSPLAQGLEDFVVDSEQYYLLVDPAVEVVASTVIVSDEMPWLRGVRMPVAWTRDWGRGAVFYCALGHGPEVLLHDPVATLLRRAARLVQRGNASRTLSPSATD